MHQDQLPSAGRAIAAIAAVVITACAALAPIAQAEDVDLVNPITQRTGAEAAIESAYVGPGLDQGPGQVGALGTSSDTYTCPGDTISTNMLVVGDDYPTEDAGYGVDMPDFDGHRKTFRIRVRSYGFTTLHFRVAATCTNEAHDFPRNAGRCLDYISGSTFACPRYGAYADAWWETLYGQFQKQPYGGSATAAQYSELIQNAFCWKSNWPDCPGASLRAASLRASADAAPIAAKRGGNRFALKKGINFVSLAFAMKQSRPPAVLLKGAKGCRATRMSSSVINGAGRLRLKLSCSRAGAVRLTIGKAISRSFHLRAGTGTLRVHLDKPPGSVEPYAQIDYGTKGTPCRSVDHHLRLRARTFDLRINARCGAVARNATGHLYVGGLLAADT